MKIAVIAAFNEATTIGRIVRNTLQYVDEVIVVDDGSSDNTADCAKQTGALVLQQKTNKGYDRALQAGFEQAMQCGAQIMLTLDADGQHATKDIPKLLNPIVSGSADLVISQRPKLNRFAEKIFARYTKRYYGVPDPLCGFKAYSREVCEKIGHFDTLNSIGTQLMLQAIAYGFKVVLIPVQINARADISRFYIQRLRGNWKILKAMMRVIWNVPKR